MVADFFEPTPGTVDLYIWDLDALSLDAESDIGNLSGPEQARADRLRFERDRQRFIAGRIALRALLGRLTGEHPRDLSLSTGPHGKPFLEGGPAFSVSHHEQHLLIGIAPEGRFGVDLEIRRPVPDAVELARGNFSHEEIASLRKYAGPEYSAAFLRVWTRKEALLKAIGAGLSMPLHLITMEVDDGQANLLKGSVVESIDTQKWCVRSVDIHEDLEVAVAWDCPEFECRMASCMR